MKRRKFIQTGGALLLSQSSLSRSGGALSTAPWNLSATEAVAAMRRGDITAESYCAGLLKRCEAYQALNAFISLNPERVLEAARQADLWRNAGKPLRPLHGLPLPVKDSICSADLPTTAGTASLRDFQPKHNAPVLQTLLSAGALLMGKTNLHELSLGVTSNNPTFGPCHNPYDATRASGGSSGGSAAAVSARLAPLAVGEDTTCSIRVPAAWCGVAGLRPTTRRYPQDGIMPITPRFDSVGPIARSVSDLLLFDQVLRPDDQGAPEPSLRGLRLGAPPDYWSGLDADVERISLDALRRLTEAGAQVVHAPLPGELKDDLSTVMDILSYEVVANETGFLRDQETGVTFQQMYEELSAPLRSRFDESFLEGSRHPIPLERYRAAVERLTVLRTRMEAYFTDNKLAALVYPPAMIAAVPIGVETDIRIGAVPSTVRTALLRNTVHASAIGMPGLVLPAGLTNSGLPVGIEFDALRGKDRALLALGLSLERALGPVPPPTLRAS